MKFRYLVTEQTLIPGLTWEEEGQVCYLTLSWHVGGRVLEMIQNAMIYCNPYFIPGSSVHNELQCIVAETDFYQYKNKTRPR